MLKIHNEIRRVDANILAAIRQQGNSGTRAKENLINATCAAEELSHKIQEIKSKAELTKAMLHNICRDIKRLDFAKKNITTAVTALSRLTMLVFAVEQLQVMTSKRQYKEAATQVEELKRTLEFEMKFGGGGSPGDDTKEIGGGGNNSQKMFSFRGLISSCFEPHLTLYIEKEEMELMQLLEKVVQVSEKDERMLCYIVNTAEYCHKTSGDLAEEVSTIIDPPYADCVDISEVQDEFSSVITRALVTLVHGLETKFDKEMVAMTRISWGTLNSVSEQSNKYVDRINTILCSSIPVLGNLLTTVYFQFFLDKLALTLGPRFYANIFRCKHISETGAQQMLLDAHDMKMILLKVPSLARQTATASYVEFVNNQMKRAEAVLKVIAFPNVSVVDTYRALVPEGTPMEFQRILELKGLTKAEQKSILDDFNNPGCSGNARSTCTATGSR
ncbi:Vps53-like N-terminal [Arabidopsis thaliana x Arabidopsis arenosa]|uniref:Vps53-like N-terminal n=1 Tax=Arabidopsis thaliana x Arabidopsis arenosa TaxID=1240361 RepID=A0A8T2C5B5_9BRAS|nr:Vps53-like N-terminal [Arabidopsis thaliana x Arabidopsis arenosa]